MNEIERVQSYIDTLVEARNEEQVGDILVGMNKYFSNLTAKEKVTILNWVVGRLVERIKE
jgi:hypothetical protein